MKIKYLLLAVVALPLVLFGIVKLYLNHQLNEFMDTVAARARPFVSVERGGVSTTLRGEASIHDIEIYITGTDDVVRIEKLTYDTPNLWYLLRDLGGVRNNRVPMSLHLNLKGLSMDLYGDLTDRMEDAINTLNLDLAGVNKLCGGRLFMGPREYRDMGYEQIIIDGNIGYEADAITEEITINMDLGFRDMGSYHLTIRSGGFLGTPFAARVPHPKPPAIDALRITYQDHSYIRRFVKYCSELGNTTEAEFIAAEVEQDPAYFANLLGFVPGPGLRAAYRELLSNPGKIAITMEWPESVDPGNLHLYKPEDIPKMLNLILTINDKPIEDLRFHFYDGKKLDVGRRISTLMTRDDKAQPVEVKKKPRRLRPRYYPVTPSRLKKYVGTHVRLTLNGNLHRDGELIKVVGNTAYVRKRLSGGNYTMQVSLGRIRKAEALLTRPPK
ncbi:MAG TPA: hypothetical protein EYP40_06820 [Chromatiales bacterium]|nr:hypothetical protein [Chromatiales bacterium]